MVKMLGRWGAPVERERGTRKWKRREGRAVAREIRRWRGWYDGDGAPWVADPDADCRHGCNGDCVVTGMGSDTCNFTCHPFLELDERQAAQLEAALPLRALRPCCRSFAWPGR